MTDEQLRDFLPKPIASRIASLRSVDGRVSVIVEASGLDRAERQDIEREITETLSKVPGVTSVNVALMAERDTSAGTNDEPSYKRQIIAVGSGKGGVGKSTLAANLAVALARSGHKVGLVDADIYGPSLPRILGDEGARSTAKNEKLRPVTSEWGVPVLSMGHLVETGKAVAWRGPMAANALKQMLDADWGDAEILIVDLPPGTGDVQLTMLQSYPPAGAVIVSTPQDLALIDAARAMQLFELGNIPVLGLVENMAGYECPDCGAISDPFGKGGAEDAATARGLPFLGRIPLTMDIRTSGDAGTPAASAGAPQAELFQSIAAKMLAALAANDQGGTVAADKKQ